MGSGHSIDGGSAANSTANPSANSNTIVVINSLSKTQLTTPQFNLMLAAMNQSLPAFCTVWGFPQITVVAGHSYVPGCFGYLNFIQGNNDSLGYHTLDTNNVPMGVINYSAHVYDNQMLGYSWDFTGINPQNPKQQHSFLSTTFGHEIFEMIGDPTLRALGPNGEKIAFVGSDGVSDPICREVCDPVCDVEMSLNVIDATSTPPPTGGNTIYMSNYVYPNWFVPKSTGPYDALSVLTGPLTLYDSNCYVTETNGQTEGSSRLASSLESKEEIKEQSVSLPPWGVALSTRPLSSVALTPPSSSDPNPSAHPSAPAVASSTDRDRGLLGASINPDLNTGAHFASHLSSSAKAARLRERQSRSQNKPTRIITTSASTSSGLAQYNQGSIRPSSRSTYQSAPISPVKEGDPLTPVNNPGISPQPVHPSWGELSNSTISPQPPATSTLVSPQVSGGSTPDPSASPISQPGNPTYQPSSATLDPPQVYSSLTSTDENKDSDAPSTPPPIGGSTSSTTPPMGGAIVVDQSISPTPSPEYSPPPMGGEAMQMVDGQPQSTPHGGSPDISSADPTSPASAAPRL